MKKCLATTGISDFWAIDSRLLFLGPWCLLDINNKKLVKPNGYNFIPSPWEPRSRVKEALNYSRNIMENLLPQLSDILNKLHGVSFPEKYWRILLGPWLLLFIGVFYDRYLRLKKAVDIYPDIFTYIMPDEQCILSSFNTMDFIQKSTRSDEYNLQLFSVIAGTLFPENVIKKSFDAKEESYYDLSRGIEAKRVIKRLVKLWDRYSAGSIVLSDMYHLSLLDEVFLKASIGFRNVGFIDFDQAFETKLDKTHIGSLRGSIVFRVSYDEFQSLLNRILPRAIPACYVENYKAYRSEIKKIKNLDKVKRVGSAVGWSYNELLKFFGAEVVAGGGRSMEFQHGGGYGMFIALAEEEIAQDKDIFYSWGGSHDFNKTNKMLPSIHFSKLKNTYSYVQDNLFFIGTGNGKYNYKCTNWLFPEDMQRYFSEKKIFYDNLSEDIKGAFLYKIDTEYGWGEKSFVYQISPDIKIVENERPVDLMKKVRCVVIDHPHTSFLEALTINVPSIFYWDHDVYVFRSEVDEYFELMRKAGILHRNSKDAAKKINEIYDDILSWWRSNMVQNARNKVCEKFACSKKDWMKDWVEELMVN